MTFSPTHESLLADASIHDDQQAVIDLSNDHDDTEGWYLGYGSSPKWAPDGVSRAFELGFERGRREWMDDCAR